MIGIIGGTGLYQLEGFSLGDQEWIETPFGEPSSKLSFSSFNDKQIVFLSRHGIPHSIAPHLINYRANLSALKQVGVSQIIAINAVGGIHPQLAPQALAIPDQIIDYTHSRASTIYDGCHINAVEHVDFTFPYDARLREALLAAARSAGIKVLENGTYAATQGPRLESAAEIQKLKRDGCDMVGMTGMPEAILARELDLAYACVALSVNWAAGLTEDVITMMQIEQSLALGMDNVHNLLKTFLSLKQD